MYIHISVALSTSDPGMQWLAKVITNFNKVYIHATYNLLFPEQASTVFSNI